MERNADSEEHSGFLVGAWARVRTPAPWLTVTAEATVARRGGEYDEGPGEPTATVDVDYVSVAVLPALRVPVGPVALSLFAGPGLDIHLRSQAAVSLQSAFREPATQVFAGVVGAGLDAVLGRTLLGVEVRHHEQLSDAFSGPAEGVRHRSTEAVFRIGRSPRGGG